MYICAIEEYGRSGRLIILSNHETADSPEEDLSGRSLRIPLSRREVRLYGLTERMEISEDQVQDLLLQAYRKCLSYSGWLLQRQDYSEKKLKEKLVKARYPSDIVSRVINELKQAHYVDDERMASRYISIHIQDRSSARIRQDLAGKGVSREVIQNAFAGMSEETARQAQISQIRKLLEKKRYDASTAGWEETQKIKAFLYRKGYNSELIRAALDSEDNLDSDSFSV